MRSMSIKDGIKVECNAKRNKSVEEGKKLHNAATATSFNF